ncbi:fatty acid desaturase [Leptospira fletcheri]|uniref:Fatty acid desaturase n=1 Tax=Leptospira fletcheri TaxID=2484981 RepID=A0A4R9GK17_9LEPT|nr:fatty acid desaturase [Leptospira fletcheri]
MSVSTMNPIRELPTRQNIRIAWGLILFFGSLHFSIPVLLNFFPGMVGIGIFFAVVSGPFSYLLWNLIHESIHGNFSNDRSQSQFWGRVLSILFGTQFVVLKASHLMHHKFNREAGDRIEFFEADSGRPRWMQSLNYYFRITFATYLFEVGIGFVLFLPSAWSKRISQKTVRYPIEDAFFKWVLKPEILSEARKDLLFTFLLYSVSFWLYGTHFWILLILLLLRAFFVSFFDNAYHYAKEIDNKNSAYNLRLPDRLSRWFLHFNYHRIHHRFPGVPWNRLPKQMETVGEFWDKGFWRQAWSQWKGLI